MGNNFNLDIGPLGAHTSTAGGNWHALLRGKAIGATTIQLFTNNPRQWQGKGLTAEDIARFKETRKTTGLRKLMSHASYLLNLGSGKGELLQKSRQAFQEEIARCHALGIDYLNFHPGAASGSTRQGCLDRIVASLLEVQHLVGRDGKLHLLIEATAGQGSVVGMCFEELAYLLERTAPYLPIAVCLDTCHIFAANYDIRTPEAFDATLDEFDRIVGLSHLFAFHLNDSLYPLGARKDRHADLGEGYIGIEAFRFLMQSPRTCFIPKYLETPGGSEIWARDIARLRSFVG